jgi:hypothetical protein
MYIVPTTNSFQQVGFVDLNGDSNSSSSAPDGATTTGFKWYGTTVAYTTEDSQYEMQFWAVTTNITGLYTLHWNSNGSLHDNATPVTVKSTPPNNVRFR